jgi:hypothetical protein
LFYSSEIFAITFLTTRNAYLAIWNFGSVQQNQFVIPQVESMEKPSWEDVFVRAASRLEAAPAQKTAFSGDGAFMKRIVLFFGTRVLFVHDGRY